MHSHLASEFPFIWIRIPGFSKHSSQASALPAEKKYCLCRAAVWGKPCITAGQRSCSACQHEEHFHSPREGQQNHRVPDSTLHALPRAVTLRSTITLLRTVNTLRVRRTRKTPVFVRYGVQNTSSFRWICTVKTVLSKKPQINFFFHSRPCSFIMSLDIFQ